MKDDPKKATGFMAWVRRNSPRREELLESRWVRPFGHRVAHTHLWRFTRVSVPRGVALGLFVGIFMLIPGVQILGVALLALPFRANIPIGAAMTFLSNPFTTPFLCAGAVWIGNSLFGLHADITALTLLWEKGASISEWIAWIFSDLAFAFFPGLFIISAVAAVIGHALATISWDSWIRRRWRRKLAKRRNAEKGTHM